MLMKRQYPVPVLLLFAILFISAGSAYGQGPETQGSPSGSGQETGIQAEKSRLPGVSTGEQLDEITEQLDNNPAAQKARESLIGWIYRAAEYLSFPAFYWVAFASMIAGLVSYGLQLVLGKLVMLIQFHFSLTEILSDGLGFVISALGLILTTRAAADHSEFISSPAQVLSAAVAGLLIGFVFYIRGQTQEYREAREIRRRNQS